MSSKTGNSDLPNASWTGTVLYTSMSRSMSPPLILRARDKLKNRYCRQLPIIVQTVVARRRFAESSLSAGHRLAMRPHHSSDHLDLLLSQLGIHRQREFFFAQPFANWKLA